MQMESENVEVKAKSHSTPLQGIPEELAFQQYLQMDNDGWRELQAGKTTCWESVVPFKHVHTYFQRDLYALE